MGLRKGRTLPIIRTTVPLSEREQQILHEIEKSLLTEDPDLAGIELEKQPRAGRRVKLGIMVFVAGIGLLVGFFVTSLLLLGLAAFGAMVGGIVLIAAGVRDLTAEGFRDFGSRRGWGEIFGAWESKLRDRYRR
jgi:Flp pilus assembly protein TadB